MRIAKQGLSLNHESAEPAELSLDELSEVRGSANQNQADEFLGLSRPVPRDSPYSGEWSAGRQLTLDGAGVTAGGMAVMWGSTATTFVPVVTPVVFGLGAFGAWLGTETIEEGAEQMRHAEARHEALREDQLRQAEEAQERELKELEDAKERREAQEREADRLLEEADQMLREGGGSASGQGGPPANLDSYSGELPSFPGQVVNATSPEPQIIIQPIGMATVGYQQESSPGRIY